jgi:hypothetical protein
MPRSKPYTVKLGILDAALTLLTSGAWLIVAIPRELIRWSQGSK